MKKGIALCLLLAIALGLTSVINGPTTIAFLTLLPILTLFIGVAQYVQTKSFKAPKENERDLGAEHSIRIHKLVPDGREIGFTDVDG